MVDLLVPIRRYIYRRISKGRTIKEFIFGVVLVPTLICTFWFAVFGGTAIHMEMFQSLGIVMKLQKRYRDWIICCYFTPTILYILTIIGLILVATFFVTSADSATFVVSMQTSNGSLSPKK